MQSKKDQILAMWMTRPESKRQREDTESFAYDETWGIGLDLHRNQHLHYQTVMAMVRSRVANGTKKPPEGG